MMKSTLLAGVSALGIVVAGAAQAAGVTDADLLNDATNTKQVVTNGLGLQGHRFSPLKQINTSTVKDLGSGLVLLFRRRKAARPGSPGPGL